MTARSIRRSLERKALKEQQRKARQQEQQNAHLGAQNRIAASLDLQSENARVNEPDAEPAAERKVLTGRSTGPRTAEGKAKSSLNAIKTALTGRTVLLPSDDAALYEQHLQQYAGQFQPVGPLECELVQSLADVAWRLLRIPELEMAIYASGHERFAERFADREPALRNNLIQMETFLTYERQLRNLHIQEGRLRRIREKDTAELRRVQQERRQQEQAARAIAAKRNVADRNTSNPSMTPFGNRREEFVFSTGRTDNRFNAAHDSVTAPEASVNAPDYSDQLRDDVVNAA
jgi:hypothetical protein